jgi:hypothetical protein
MHFPVPRQQTLWQQMLWQPGLMAMVAVTGLILMTPATVRAQASETEMGSFPMPPPSGYAVTKNFNYVGDYGYFLQPSTATYSMDTKAKDYRYVRYTGVNGKNVWVYGAWGTTAIGNATPKGDNCGHAHVSYGVWVKYRYKLPLFNQTFWSFTGGGGMSGVRNDAGKCVHKVDNPLKSIDSRFGWGQEALNLNFKSLPSWVEAQEVVVGALANTHGWGSCPVPSGKFPACHEPAWIIGYTLP